MAVLSITSHVAMAPVGHGAQGPVFQHLAIPYWAVPTVTLAGHGAEARPGGGPLGEAVLSDLIDAAAANPRFGRCEVIMSGYLGRAGAVAPVARAAQLLKARSPAARYVCDPVIGDSGADGQGRLYVPADLAGAIRDRLIPRADVVLPNAFEAAWLSGRPVDGVAGAEAAARDLIAFGAGACVVTGVPMSDDRLGSVLVDADGTQVAWVPRVVSRAKGSGDLFAALFVAHTLSGASNSDAVTWASTGAGRAMAFAADDDLADLPLIDNLAAIVDVEGPFGPLPRF